MNKSSLFTSPFIRGWCTAVHPVGDLYGVAVTSLTGFEVGRKNGSRKGSFGSCW